MTSMERFGAVSVDYFTGREVERVSKGEEGAVWTIHFEGGGELRNYDPTITLPDSLPGMSLTRTTLSTSNTQLHFGKRENPLAVLVNLNALQYSIIDPTYTEGQEVYAQRSDANMPPEPPQEPVERIADGPSEEFLASEPEAEDDAAA